MNLTLFGIGLQQKLFQSHKNICFEAIQNGGKSKAKQAWVKKTVYGVETYWLSGKKKVPDTVVSKES